jgi:hypothetical protein
LNVSEVTARYRLLSPIKYSSVLKSELASFTLFRLVADHFVGVKLTLREAVIVRKRDMDLATDTLLGSDEFMGDPSLFSVFTVRFQRSAVIGSASDMDDHWEISFLWLYPCERFYASLWGHARRMSLCGISGENLL